MEPDSADLLGCWPDDGGGHIGANGCRLMLVTVEGGSWLLRVGETHSLALPEDLTFQQKKKFMKSSSPLQGHKHMTLLKKTPGLGGLTCVKGLGEMREEWRKKNLERSHTSCQEFGFYLEAFGSC